MVIDTLQEESQVLARTGYPGGVPCWVDIVQPDLDATMAFYGGLLGWTFEVRTPEDAVPRYTYALLDGLVVAGVGSSPAGEQPIRRAGPPIYGSTPPTRLPLWSRRRVVR